MEKNFDLFMSQLKETNQTLDFFCDFGKIEANIEEIKLSLCMLNSLIGSTDLRKSVEAIWKRDKTAFNVMEILIAVRSKDKKKALDPRGCYVTLNSFLSNIDGIIDFLNQTGLAEVLCKRKIKDLVDYVFGIETGLDSNARKNRSGKIMEATIANIFKIHGVTYRQEIYSNKRHDITKALGTDKKRFDFVIETQQKTYLIEVNFYSDGGSKLNEVARSYSEIAPKINAISGFEFVWITDGIGWKSARNKLQEAYGIIPSIYNLTNISDFINIIKS